MCVAASSASFHARTVLTAPSRTWGGDDARQPFDFATDRCLFAFAQRSCFGAFLASLFKPRLAELRALFVGEFLASHGCSGW
ncbi:hypothetical protein C6T56_15965 [Burkholderia multivorans]|nr:hypothetical protein C6T56_15965 [Burkholderia multivorans]